MIIGRKNEIKIIEESISDNKSHFISVYGRRRIGKTYLVNNVVLNRFLFKHSGIWNEGLKVQLKSFEISLSNSGLKPKRKIKCWLDAFDCLRTLVENSNEEKKIIFLDELSWMDTPKSDLMAALENFWNLFASARNDIVLIVSASATSWMLKKIIHNKGGLYNRLTDQIHLTQFNLNECEEYLIKNDITLTRLQILEYYMIFGGVPFYWKYIKKGLSMTQNIDYVLFSEQAPLKEEFKYLYGSIFTKPDAYLQIIKCLANKKIGLTRENIIEETGINNSGDLTIKLEELESCGFIRKYTPFGVKKKNSIYQLIDNYTIFYYTFLKDYPTDEKFWSNQINTAKVNAWKGYSFERVCMEHIKQIKNKMGISGILTSIYSWSTKANIDKGIKGSQIDLIIERKDQIINICEMKYSINEYTIDKDLYENIENKINNFITNTKTYRRIIKATIYKCNLRHNIFGFV